MSQTKAQFCILKKTIILRINLNVIFPQIGFPYCVYENVLNGPDLRVTHGEII